jgi:hypothetical protein
MVATCRARWPGGILLLRAGQNQITARRAHARPACSQQSRRAFFVYRSQVMIGDQHPKPGSDHLGAVAGDPSGRNTRQRNAHQSTGSRSNRDRKRPTTGKTPGHGSRGEDRPRGQKPVPAARHPIHEPITAEVGLCAVPHGCDCTKLKPDESKRIVGMRVMRAGYVKRSQTQRGVSSTTTSRLS